MMQQRAIDTAQADAAREKLRFLQRLDHELKNPLTAMQIALANLDDTTDTHRRQEISDSLHGQLRRMSVLINDLRKLAALEKGEFERIPVNIQDLLDDVTAAFYESDEAPSRHIITEIDALPTLTGDRDLLHLAIYNIVDNTRKFTQAGDTITLRAIAEDDGVVIQVIDTGRGIPAEDIPHIWEDLYRSTDVQGIPGSGVGLAMVKGIIEGHGGSVAVSSTLRSGTTITLRIPLG